MVAGGVSTGPWGPRSDIAAVRAEILLATGLTHLNRGVQRVASAPANTSSVVVAVAARSSHASIV